MRESQTTMEQLTKPRRRRIGAVLRFLIGIVFLVGVVVALGVTGVLPQVRSYIPGLPQPAPTFQTTMVRRGDVTTSVTATGPVATVNSVPLTFKTSGKLATLKVGVGDHVKQGQVLATLDPTDLTTALNQAKANLEQAQANLTKVQRGPTADQKAVAQASVNSARLNLANAQANVPSTQTSVADSLTTAQASVTTAQQSLVAAQHGLQAAQDQQTRGIAADQAAIDTAQKNLASTKASVAANLPTLEQGVQRAKDSLWSSQISRDSTCSHGQDSVACKSANAGIAADETGVDSAQAQIVQGQIQGQQQIAQAQTQVDQAVTQLASDKAKFAEAITTAQDQVKQAENAVANAQTGVAQARHKADASAQTAQQQVDQASQALQSAEANFRQSTAPPDDADVAAAKAQVLNAQSALGTAQANYDAATLTAPMDATVAAINGSVGQYVSGGPVAVGDSALFTLVELDDLKVTALVNEADIGQVQVGDPVSFTVNAYGDKTFAGKVLTIQPLGTTVQNVVNYSVTCSIAPSKDAVLFPGMTATATIVTAQHPNVLRVPNTALSFSQTFFREGFDLGTRSTGAATAGSRPAPAGPTSGSSGGSQANAPTGRRASAVGSAGSGAASATGGARAASAQTAGRSAPEAIVLVLRNGKPELARVGTGLSDGTVTEITSGLTEGEAVIVGLASGSPPSNRGSGGNNGQRPGGGSPFTGGIRG